MSGALSSAAAEMLLIVLERFTLRARILTQTLLDFCIISEQVKLRL